MNALSIETGNRLGIETESPHVIELFDGIRLIRFQSDETTMHKFRVETGNCIFILGCTEGGLEIPVLENGSILSAGDVAVLTDRRDLDGIRTTGEPFNGLMIVLDPDLLPERIDCFLTGIQLNLEPLLRCGDERKKTRVLRGNPLLRHLLSDCSELPESIRTTFQKLKALELLLYLGSTDPEACEMSYFPGFQLDRIRAVKEYITENIDRRVTLDELAERFNMSQSSLKSCFKCVYGLPIATYARNFRLERAASLLRKSQYSILEISCMIGYENPGKFAEAFRSVYQVSPRQYRKEENRSDYFLSVSA